jgi:Cu(I)/Ag(I) efflux system membrane fusion protein
MVTSSPFGATRVPRRTWSYVVGGLFVVAVVAYMLVLRNSPPSAALVAASAQEGAIVSPTEMPVTLGAEGQTRIGVTFAPVLWGPLDREVRTVAQVNVDETRVKTVAPLVEGWVDRLFVDFTGQSVRAGDPLFSLYSPMVVSAEEELILAKRLESGVGGGTPEARQSAAALLEAARRRLRYWGIPDEEILRAERTEQAGRTVTFRSGYTGVVLEKGVTAGQRLMPGDVAYRIVDLSQVWLEGEVFERDLPAIRLGLTVRAEFAALPADVRTGRIAYIYPTIDPQTRTARIRVELPNPGLVLKPGMYATIRFATPGTPTLSVPRSAVLSTGERNLVFVRSGTHFVPHLVSIGSATDDRVEILSGVLRGDTVVASGTFLMDAESNLGSLLGGMGNMPGMDMTVPGAGHSPGKNPPATGSTDGSMPGMEMPIPRSRTTPAPPAAEPPARRAPAVPPADSQARMPGMDHSSMPMPR